MNPTSMTEFYPHKDQNPFRKIMAQMEGPDEQAGGPPEEAKKPDESQSTPGNETVSANDETES